MVELTHELIKALSKTRNGFYSWDYVAGLAVWILGVEANNERLQARVQELEQERRWIPVSEPVEGNNLEILCYSNEAPHYESYFAIYIDGIFGEYESGKFLEVFPKPTHYMYKPKPPKYKPPQPPKEEVKWTKSNSNNA